MTSTTTAVAPIYTKTTRGESKYPSSSVAANLYEAFSDVMEGKQKISDLNFPTVDRESLNRILTQPDLTMNAYASNKGGDDDVAAYIKGDDNPALSSVLHLFRDFSILRKSSELIDQILDNAKPKLNFVAAEVKKAFSNEQERLKGLLRDFDDLNLGILNDFNSFLGESPLGPATES